MLIDEGSVGLMLYDYVVWSGLAVGAPHEAPVVSV
jgi:hypothetical protein